MVWLAGGLEGSLLLIVGTLKLHVSVPLLWAARKLKALANCCERDLDMNSFNIKNEIQKLTSWG